MELRDIPVRAFTAGSRRTAFVITTSGAVPRRCVNPPGWPEIKRDLSRPSLTVGVLQRFVAKRKPISPVSGAPSCEPGPGDEGKPRRWRHIERTERRLQV